MIRINLLPQQYSVKARTPIKLLLTIAGTVAINASLLAYLAWLFVAVKGSVETELATLQLDMDGLGPQVTYHKDLESDKQKYKSREDTLADITKSRVSWTRKVDELIDVINKGDEGQRHLIWLDDLVVNQNSDPRNPSNGSVRANGHSGSEKFAQVADFLEDLEQSPFISDFYEPGSPEGSESVRDDDLIPPVVWSFPLSLKLKAPEERQ